MVRTDVENACPVLHAKTSLEVICKGVVATAPKPADLQHRFVKGATRAVDKHARPA